jgi:sugar phosphate isomerase/epimerase
MTKPISVQLYSVREEMNEDVWGTIGKIAEMGYVGVEPCNVPGGDVAEAAKRIGDLGLVVSGYQAGTPVGDKKNQLLDEAQALGTDRIVCPYYSPDSYKTMDALKEAAAIFNEAIANCEERGLTFGYHNHAFEIDSEIDGKPALLQLAALCPKLYFTVDTYWVTVGGQSAPEFVAALGPQADLLHIKDGPLVKGEALVAAGTGKMDFPPIVAAATAARWLIVELDRCDTDMMEAVGASFKYLVDSGLGHGK